MTQEPEILFETRGHIGLITLNRPTALNALTLGMIRQIDSHLIDCACNNDVYAVVIRGAGDRAFCSGGDVKAVALEAKGAEPGSSPLARDFFREEYTLNNRIHSFPKPYISLINGIVMGGGKGISAHGSHRIVTEDTVFAMPETNIGFFPDVGGGYFLPRCPGQTGLYLAMTSKRIKAIDTLYIGFATHFVRGNNFAPLLDKLTSMEWSERTSHMDQVTALIESFAEEAPDASAIGENREKIDRCFGSARVEDIFLNLQNDGSDWANETLEALHAMSPTSLKVALRQIREGAKLDFAHVMTMEYRLSQRLIYTHDFYEGIRAALIDKDRQPKWSPPRPDEVPDALIDSFFEPLGAQDLVLK